MAGVSRSRSQVLAVALVVAMLIGTAFSIQRGSLWQNIIDIEHSVRLALLPQPAFIGKTPGKPFMKVTPVEESFTAMKGEKSLFERTKNINSEMSEKNSQNELLMDTDNFWGIFFIGVSVLLTVGFVVCLQGLKPASPLG